jgi:hypothetical protein
MPKNCSADVEAVIKKVDTTFLSGNPTAIQAVKDNFGLGSMKHLDDVAGACTFINSPHGAKDEGEAHFDFV